MSEGHVCANCGMPERDWTGSGGMGHLKDGVDYCCEGCAEHRGCSCFHYEESHLSTFALHGGRSQAGWRLWAPSK